MNAEITIETQGPGAPEPLKRAQAVKEDHRLIFPFDLSEWMPKESLLGTITALIEEFNWGNPELVKYLQAHPNYRPKMLLRLLCFAYTNRVFAAEEIQSNCFTDPFLRSICENDPPQAREISRFRRFNRGLLKWLLAQLFKEALKEKFDLGDVNFPAGLRRFLVKTAEERLDLARHMDGAGYEF